MPVEAEDISTMSNEERRSEEGEQDSIVSPLLHDHHNCLDAPKVDSCDHSRPQSPNHFKERHSKTGESQNAYPC